MVYYISRCENLNGFIGLECPHSRPFFYYLKSVLLVKLCIHNQVPTPQDQVSCMVENGVEFKLMSKSDAERFLTYSNFFFKVKAFDKNFDKYKDEKSPCFGKYINLDFEYLVDLSRKDASLRELILDLALDLEHYLKVAVNRVLMNAQVDTPTLLQSFFTFSEQKTLQEIGVHAAKSSIKAEISSIRVSLEKLDSTIKEDNTQDDIIGTLVSEIYSNSNKMCNGYDSKHVIKSLEHLGSSYYSRRLFDKYGNIDNMEPWHFMEMSSFGDFISFYKYIFFDSNRESELKSNPSTTADASKAKQIKNLLFPAKTLRNAAAHNDCLLNTLNDRMKKPIKSIFVNLSEIDDIDKTLLEKAWKTPVVHDFAALLICYDLIVPMGESKDGSSHKLQRIHNCLSKDMAYYDKQENTKHALLLLANIVHCFAKSWKTQSNGNLAMTDRSASAYLSL